MVHKTRNTFPFCLQIGISDNLKLTVTPGFDITGMKEQNKFAQLLHKFGNV